MAPLALIAFTVIVDQLTPVHWLFNRFLEGAPALAAATRNPVGTGVIGAFAIVVDIVLAADKGNLGMSRAWLMLGMIALVTVAAPQR